MANPNQQIEDYTIRLIVTVRESIHTLVWVTNPVATPPSGSVEEDNYQPTGWYYDQQDIPFFCGRDAQAAAHTLRQEVG